MTDEIIIDNATISSTSLGFEKGIFTFNICFDFYDFISYCGFYSLDEYSQEKGKRVGTAEGLSAIMELLKVLDVNYWEDLNGTYVEVKYNKTTRNILAIRRHIGDDWFSLEEFFKNLREENKEL